MTIRVRYEKQPSFPATDQHPDAVRYKVGAVWVDAIGGEPTAQEVAAFGIPTAQELDAFDDADIDNMYSSPGRWRALVKMIGDLQNQVRVLNGLPTLPEPALKAITKERLRNGSG